MPADEPRPRAPHTSIITGALCKALDEYIRTARPDPGDVLNALQICTARAVVALADARGWGPAERRKAYPRMGDLTCFAVARDPVLHAGDAR